MSVPRNNLHLLRKITEEKVNIILDNQLSTLINNSISDDIDEIINNINVKAIEDEVLLQFKRTHSEKSNKITLNHANYSSIIHNLNNNSSVIKLKSLQELLNALVIDTKQNFWPNLSHSLQKCSVSNNIDIFLHVLKIHHKILSFSNTFLDGYMSLLKSTVLLLNSRYRSDSVRLAPTLKLILNSHSASNKFLLHASRKIIEEIIFLFIKIINVKTVLELTGSLDSKASWLEHFCHGSFIRNNFFETLQEIASPLIKHVAIVFIELFIQENDYSKLYTCYFFFYFLKYQVNFRFFPIQISDNETITPSYLIELIIFKIEEKNDPELENLLVKLFESNPQLVNIKILNFLLEILSKNYEQSEYVLRILTNLVQTKKPSIIFEVYNRIRKGRHRIPRYITNIPQKIVEITTESLENESNNILVSLRCCRCLLESHSVTLIQINPSKLIITLQIFYKNNFKNISHEITKEIFLLFNFFYSNFCSEIFLLLADENIPILNDLLTFFPIKSSSILLNKIADNKTGFEVVKNNAGKLLQPYLEKVWSNSADEKNSSSFLFFLLSLQFNIKIIVAILNDENEGTVVETDDKSVVFSELIEKTLGNNTIESDEEYIGLLSMKVMIMNLNLLAHLQANHQMQEKIQELNNERVFNGNSNLILSIIRNLADIGVVDVDVLQQEIISENYALLSDQHNEFVVFLKSGKQTRDLGWILQARRLFKNNIDTFQPCMLSLLLENIPKVKNYFETLPDSFSFDPDDQELYPEDSICTSIIINFGLKQNLLRNEDLSLHENLTLLLKQTKSFLGKNSSEFERFDWFTGVIFLICCGDLEQSKSMIINFNQTPFAGLIWMENEEQSDFEFKEKFYGHFKIVLEENSRSFHALKILNMSPGLIIRSWLTQCFFDVLTLEEIAKFLAFCVLHPIEFSLYYFASIFRYLEESICALTHDRSIDNIFKMVDLSGFHLSNYMNLIEKLSKQYRNFHKLSS